MQKVQKPYPRVGVPGAGGTESAVGSIAVRRTAAMSMSSTTDTRLGTLLLEEGLISESQLQEALRTQSDADVYQPIGQLLVEQKAISAKQLNAFIDKYHKRARFGEILLKSKTITGEQLEIALS